MAVTTRFWIPTMIRAKAIGSGALSAHPDEWALDGNLDSYWQHGTNPSVIDVQLDPTGFVGTYTWAGLWIHNYLDSNFQSAPNLLALTVTTDNDSAFGSPTATDIAAVDLDPATMLPLYFALLDGGSTVAESYIRFSIDGPVDGGSIPYVETSLVFVGTHYDLTDLRWNWESIGPITRQHNTVEELPGARTIVRSQRSLGTRFWRRRYEMITGAQLQTILDAHVAANGRFQPFIIQDDEEDINDAKLVRFTEDQISVQGIAYDLYNCEFGIEEVPYIRDGTAW